MQFNYTIEDKILLHLFDYVNFQDDYEVTFNVTQPGISKIIGIRRSHASSVLKGMKHKELVEERNAHVKNFNRKRKVYFLTDKGINLARKIRVNLRKQQIKFKNQSGEIKNVDLSEIITKCGKKLSVLDILNSISSKGLLEERVMNHHVKTRREVGSDSDPLGLPVVFIDPMVQPTRFIGRNKEFQNIMKLLDGALPKFIIVKGIAGIGKTTLAAKIIDHYLQKTERALFWYRFHSWDSVNGLLKKLSEFLNQLGKRTLKYHLEHEKDIDLNQIMTILESDLVEINGILIFDDYQKIRSVDKMKELFSMFSELQETQKCDRLKILILSRQEPGFYDRRKVAIKKLISEIELSGLDYDESKELLNLENIEERYLKEIYKITDGHPLTLELIGNSISQKQMNIDDKDSNIDLSPEVDFNLNELFKEDHDVNKYLRDEIFEALSDHEKNILNLISIYRYPVDSDGLLLSKEVDYSCIDGLSQKYLIHETSLGFDAHELIKEFFYHRLNPEQRKKYHMAAGEFYLSELQSQVYDPAELSDQNAQLSIETQHHLLTAGDYERGAQLAVEHGDSLINNGLSEEFFYILDRINRNNVTKKIWLEVIMHKGHILIFNGSWDTALNCFNESLKLGLELGNDCAVARAYNGIGVIYYRKGSWKKSMEYYKKGLEIAKRVDDKQNCSKLTSNMALVHWGNGDLTKAIDLIKKSLKLSEKLDDTQGIARAYNNLGIIYWEQERLDDAISSYSKSLDLAQKLGDKHTIAILYDNLGEVYRKKGDQKKAKEFYMESLALSEELGFKWQIAEVNYNLGCLCKELDREKSKDYFQNALKLYQALGAKREVEKVEAAIFDK